MRLRDPEAFSSVMDGPRSGLLSLAGDKKCHCLQTLRCLVSFSLLSPWFDSRVLVGLFHLELSE